MDDMIKQAKQKALSLLNYMDRTESQLRQKLQEKSFDEQAIDAAVEYVKSFDYINDVSYAERYILNRQGTKSKREIYAALCQKGICREDIERAMESCYEAEDEFAHQAMVPIICEGDVIGAVLLLEAEPKSKMGEVEQKLLQSAATFLGRQMEQ
jgi:SOS response regulatory protein OraA/RecX